MTEINDEEIVRLMPESRLAKLIRNPREAVEEGLKRVEEAYTAPPTAANGFGFISMAYDFIEGLRIAAEKNLFTLEQIEGYYKRFDAILLS